MSSWPQAALVGAVRAYRFALSPLLGGSCRFEPTCSAYALEAIERHGVVVHPGYFYDFDRDGYFVVSLLTDPEKLEEGIARIV